MNPEYRQKNFPPFISIVKKDFGEELSKYFSMLVLSLLESWDAFHTPDVKSEDIVFADTNIWATKGDF